MNLASYYPSRTTLRLIAGAAIMILATVAHTPIGEKLVMLQANMTG